MKFKEKPFSVVLSWFQNKPIGERVIYVEGKWNGQMLVMPKGWRRTLVGDQFRKPDCKEAMQNTLRPVNIFGFKRGMQSLLKVYGQAKKAGHLDQRFGGRVKIEGRECIVLVRYLPAKNDYPAWETEVYIDLEYLVPIRIEGKNWDKKISCIYQYKNVTFNVGLKDSDFRAEANGMKAPK